MQGNGDGSQQDDSGRSRQGDLHGGSDWDELIRSWAAGEDENPIEDGLDGMNALDGAGDQREEGERASWVSRGGILQWEESGEEAQEGQSKAGSEAASRWAADAIDLPPGAPDHLRVRSLRAWLLRRRLLETEELGQLLLERRRAGAGEDSDEPPDSPLELAILERQAAIEVYEALVESLDEMASHSGPARLLVEYYLWLNERLVMLAEAVEAPADFAARAMLPLPDSAGEGSGGESTRPEEPSPTAKSIAEWQGRAQAALAARRRIEQVSAPEPEE
jgi:hypothetical protein